jgi:uncharacterized membrane protein (UPF0127 family)
MGKCRFTRIIGLAVSLTFGGSAASATCSEDVVSVRGAFGTAQFDVSVADTDDERAQGLMFVESMGTLEGMLFIFDAPRRVSFWMRNTLIPLDMIFVDKYGVVSNIHSMAQPLDETPIFGGGRVQYVLEINGGMADRLGLEVGNQMQHPAFGATSIWPCT